MRLAHDLYSYDGGPGRIHGLGELPDVQPKKLGVDTVVRQDVLQAQQRGAPTAQANRTR